MNAFQKNGHHRILNYKRDVLVATLVATGFLIVISLIAIADRNYSVVNLQAREMTRFAKLYVNHMSAVLGRHQAAGAADPLISAMPVLQVFCQENLPVARGSVAIIRGSGRHAVCGDPNVARHEWGAPMPIHEFNIEIVIGVREWRVLTDGFPDGREGVESLLFVLILNLASILGFFIVKRSVGKLSSAVVDLTTDYERRNLDSELELKERSRFMGAMAHDIRQPVSAIGMFSEVMASGAERNEDANARDKISSSLRVINQYLDQIGEMAKLDILELRPSITEFPLPAVFEELQHLFSGTTEHLGVEIVFLPGFRLSQKASLLSKECCYMISTDRLMLSRIIGNMIDNAVKSGATRVVVCARQRKNNLEIQVRDNGAGIELENQSAIFDEFFQSAANTTGLLTRGGIGLGLSIVKKLAETIRARIQFRSIPGEGTVFSVTLRGVSVAVVPLWLGRDRE